MGYHCLTRLKVRPVGRVYEKHYCRCTLKICRYQTNHTDQSSQGNGSIFGFEGRCVSVNPKIRYLHLLKFPHTVDVLKKTKK